MQRVVYVNDNEIPQTLAYAEWMPPFAQPNQAGGAAWGWRGICSLLSALGEK